MIRIRDLAVEFPVPNGVPLSALRGVSLDIDEGERVGLVGESGSGKSLTALACLGLLPEHARVTAGSVELGGNALPELDARGLRAWRGGTVGLVFQEAADALNPVYSVGTQLAEAIRAHRPLDRRRAREEALSLLRAVAVDDPETVHRAFPHQLSGGQAQRVMLAIALAGGPRLLIADEPTSALDAVTRAEVMALLSSLAETQGLALLLVSHDLAVVRDAVDRVLVMYAGQVIEEGPAADVFERPLHPATQELMAAAELRLAPPGTGAIPLTDLAPPSPAGCSFSTRCGMARPECHTTAPQLVEISPRHRLRCPVAAEELPGALGEDA